jgi:hypothetical protein
MNKTNSFTYVIGYKHSNDRINNLRRVLDWINGFQGVDVILVEQDKHSKISHLNLNCRHIFLKTKQSYNRSWAFNVATKNAKSGIIVFGDSDIIMDPNKFIESLRNLEKFDMVSPYKSVLDLTPEESNLPLTELYKINKSGRGEHDNQKINPCGGIVMYRADAINKIGGWCEDFIGWGGEDDFEFIKSSSFLTWTEMPNKCYHLYHNRTAPDKVGYQKTLQLLNTLKSLSKEDLARHISTSAPRIGRRNLNDNY